MIYHLYFIITTIIAIITTVTIITIAIIIKLIFIAIISLFVHLITSIAILLPTVVISIAGPSVNSAIIISIIVILNSHFILDFRLNFDSPPSDYYYSPGFINY